ncbi:protein TCL1B2-like [Mesocricetus auratus]|uniref:Protein TCL1B2-like n=1 Tax=Mesocricetus auratus TaxID=10036 RepID=A0ABM2X8Y6_MESAU|nr:protein TCL1B2-like [Mesocricetus auratus]
MASTIQYPPVTLTMETPGYYRDENQRLWLVVGLGFTLHHPFINKHRASIKVRLCRVGECCAELLSHFFSSLTCLPSEWHTNSLFSYNGADSSFWIIEEHVQLEDTEHLVLEVETELGLQSSSASCWTEVPASEDPFL